MYEDESNIDTQNREDAENININTDRRTEEKEVDSDVDRQWSNVGTAAVLLKEKEVKESDGGSEDDEDDRSITEGTFANTFDLNNNNSSVKIIIAK